MTLEELFEMKKKRKGIILGLGIVMLFACTLLIFLAIKNGQNSLITVAICCFITLIPSISLITQIDKEIKSRESK